MPVAKSQIPPEMPAPIAQGEADFVKATVKRFYGESAIVRSWSPDPKHMRLHVESDEADGIKRYDCLGVLLTRIERDQISLDVTQRGSRVSGNAKIAYRQGVVL
jgi:hypothetical protein